MSEVSRGGSVKNWGLLVIAVVIAMGAFWLSTRYLTNKEGLLREQIIGERAVTSSYVVASVDSLPGDIIGPENMAVAEIVSDNISTFAVRPEEFEEFNGQVLKYPMTAGEPLLSHFVAGKGIERFSDLLGSNERAITLDIDALNSASGMLVAGDFVDLMLVMDAVVGEGEESKKNLRPLLQNVRVLALDAMPLVSKEQDFVALNGVDSGYSNVTVGLDFEDAAKLVLARDVGEILFMLRNKEDHNLHDSALVTQLDLESGSESANNYQFYSSTNSNAGVIMPVVKSISPNIQLDSSKMIFSVAKKKEKEEIKNEKNINSEELAVAE